MGGFAIERFDKKDVSILNLTGFLDLHTVPKFEEAIQNLVNERRFQIIVNLNNLEYISSAGLGVFMGFIEDIRENQGDIKLSNLSERVFKVFDLLGFPALFEIFDKEEQALKQFNKVD